MSFLYSQSLVAFLSALKVQSTKGSNPRKVAIIYTGLCEHMGDNYLQAVCSATSLSQCEARADGPIKGESKVKTI